ncbi:putative disease resistance protein RGA4 [Beta vulgaris subsp. vulgaris]|uniref:putative disease resistance protein RGA4 n=1 Tax=Beta vulgaris subsp. vulgaris TaxID=3555 RepID=UPI002036DE41|nr:putative disease resistance protein RGA4 [Beta vulgaris subsp. vulgaris]
MAEAILYGVAVEVLKKMGSMTLDKTASAWGFKGELEKLKNSICSIKDFLMDAEEKQADSHAVRGWLERLATVVYAADDLFDQVATVASRKQLMGRNKLVNEVQTFFSQSNQIAFAINISRKIKIIRQGLDDIVNDSAQFAFIARPVEEKGIVCKRRDQTYSIVDAEEVIGRDGDKNAILDMLLTSCSTNDDHEHQREVLPVITIVGIGGLGKTTLAQLVYNDPLVEEHFDLRLWVCVSDVFDIKVITENILKSITLKETQNLEIEQLQGQLRKEVGAGNEIANKRSKMEQQDQLHKEVGDKKYLLVLDDVWNEEREEWLKLRALLKVGRKGSKILVTTRSLKVAKIMGTVPPYELQGLSDENSWELFQKMAFEPGQAQQQQHLVEVGREIIKKCVNCPLAIRTLGNLLYGEDENKWFSLRKRSLAKIPENKNGIIKILKLSYHHLQSPLKNCFAYCALFPKGYEFDKETLIDLWIAEGFITPSDIDGSENLEEIAEEYFLTLLRRCFFQDIKRDEWGAMKSCKMHDLMHDLAQQVAGVKCKVTKLDGGELNGKIYHLSVDYSLDQRWMIPSCTPNLELLRTFLLPEQIKDGLTLSKSICQQLILRFGCLRVLDLHNLGLYSLPNSIGRLIHLRYLNLSKTCIEELPKTITKLHNLQTLKLHRCLSLRRLPKNIRQLVKLRNLDLGKCDELDYMPSGIEELTSLEKLPLFIVNCKHLGTARFKDLRNLEKLRGVLHIKVLRELKDPFLEAREANLRGKCGLVELFIEFLDLDVYLESYANNVNGGNHDKALLEGLTPHYNLKKLGIKHYRGQFVPSWANNLCVSLPGLVEIELSFGRCQKIPSFSQLPSLKRLTLVSLKSVKYMESDPASSTSSLLTPTERLMFFPSLRELILIGMTSLKAWWKEAYLGVEHPLLSMSFSHLSKLDIGFCPNLVILPLCPNVEELILEGTSSTLSVLEMATNTSTTTSPSSSGSGLKLKKLRIDNVEDQLLLLPKQSLHHLASLYVLDPRLEDTLRLGEICTSLISLRYLEFSFCDSLRCISKGLEHLTSLEELVFRQCEKLDLSLHEEQEDEDMPWKTFETSLHSLVFHKMPKLLRLPSGLQHLTNLRSLQISDNDELMEVPEWISCFSSLGYMELYKCPKITSLPNSFSKLTALNELQIVGCDGLTESCRSPNGKYWPKIQHIPLIIVRTSYSN